LTGGPDPAADPGRQAERRTELRQGLAEVTGRIATACAAAGRNPEEVTLIAVTKTFPASDAAVLAGLGVGDLGENRDQEAAPKAAALAALGLAPRWHFIGQLQANKAASVVRYADFVHSVDRLRLVRALGSHAVSAGRVITCLIQVNLDADADADAGAGGSGVGGSGGGGSGVRGSAVGRGGAAPAEALALAAAINGQDGLELGGVMAVAPLGVPARPAFRRLKAVSETVMSEYPAARMISAGMSGDLDEAIAEGATHVRVGTALLGGRPPFVR
jgi:uncharacterized pyridoxal phosphate-containing UPF0001 family protein